MILILENVLTSAEHQEMLTQMAAAPFLAGELTAGWHAKLVKKNSQVAKNCPQYQELLKIVKIALQRNTLLQMAVQPKYIHSVIFSRYQEGMSYGTHVDNALMGDQGLRSDVSFTLFLTPPGSYEGGELSFAAPDGDRCYKLDAGALIAYPSSTLHEVKPVTQGSRLVAVGWIQSLVRNPADREILYDLDRVRRSIFEKNGKTAEFDLISQTYANLLRKWAD